VISDTDHNDPLLAQFAQAQALDRQGREHIARGDIIAAAASWTEAAAGLRSVASGMVLRLAEVLERAATASVQAGRAETGMAIALEAVARLRAARGDVAAPALAARLGSLGQFFCVVQDWETACEVLAQADSWFDGAADRDALRERVRILDALSAAHRFAGQPDAAIAMLREAAALGEMVAEATNSFPDRFQVLQLRNDLGQILLERNDPQAAMPVLRDCVDRVGALLTEARAPHARNLLAAACNRLGHAHAALQDRDAAVACFEHSVTLMRELVETEGHAGLAEDLATATRDLNLARA
jgi:tetratricopeptide (TPR) repeat protein